MTTVAPIQAIMAKHLDYALDNRSAHASSGRFTMYHDARMTRQR